MADFFTGLLGHLLASGGHDVLLSSPVRKTALGDVIYARDEFGPRYFKYVKSVAAAAMVKGNVVSMAGDANGLTNIAAVVLGSVDHFTTTGLTAGMFEGGQMYVTNKSATAGAAPEGEAVPVKNNSATRVDLLYPVTVALAVSDVVELQATNAAQLCASGDNVWAVLGALVCDVGIAEYFWAQYKGPCRIITENTITTAVGTQAICGATAGKVDGVAAGTTFLDVIGRFKFAIAVNDLVNDFGWINIACDEAGPVASTLDATA